MKTILMVKVGSATFVERDERILSRHFRLKVFRFRTKGLGFLASVVGFWIWIVRHVWTADLLFTRFAHYHAFLLGIAGFLFGKKVVIVVGGSDAVWLPRYGYGVYDGWLSRHTTPWALKLATLILPNHASLVQGVNAYSDDPPRKEGLLEYTPDLTTPIRVVHNGFDSDFWKPEPGSVRENMILEVAPATDRTVFMTKGLPEFLRTAGLMPKVPFTLVGVNRKDAEHFTGEPSPANVTFLLAQSEAQLRSLYSRAKVFAHFTLTEGMPNVLCEAMLCECVPVGSTVNSLPDIIGDTGFLIPRRDPELMRDTLWQALKASSGRAARERVMSEYPQQKRETELNSILHELIGRS